MNVLILGKMAESIKKVRIDFNKAHPTYLNSKGIPVVGVTTALNLLDKPALRIWAYNKGKAGENLYETGESANAGTVSHERIKAYFLGYEIDRYNISEHIWNLSTNSLKSFYSYIKGKKIEPILIEAEFVSERYQYGGTLDLFAKVNGRLELWDYKSGTGIYDTHVYQMSGYNNLIIENKYDPPERVIPINIPKGPDDGFDAPEFNPLFLKNEFKIFLDLVDIYYRKKKSKLMKKGKY